MSEGREEANWKHAKDSYKAVQRGINSGYQVELYDDVSRMVPTWIHPRCEKREVDAFPFERELLSRRRSSGKSSTKVPKKRNSDPKRNAPEGALLGFLKASEIALGSKKAGGKGKQKESENKEGEDEMSDEDTKAKRNKLFFSDDSDDAKLEEGLTFSPLLQSRRSNSNLKLPSRSSHGSDSSGVGTIAKAKPTPSKQSRGRRLGLSRATASSVKRVLDGNSSDTLSDEDPAGPSKYASEFMFPEPPASARASRPATRRVSSPTSPIQPRGRRTDDAELGMSWNFTSDVEDELEAAKSGSRPLRGTTGLHRHSSPARAEPIQIDSSPILHIRRPPHPLIAELVALENLHSSDGDEDDQEDKKAEAEAEAEVHGAEQQEETGNAWSQGSITNESPIVAPQRRARLTRVARRIQTSSSPIPPAREETGLMAPPRMMAARAGGSRAVATKASAKGTKRKKKRIGNSPNSKFLFRWEAERDTDEERHGERDEDDEGLSTDQEDDDDRAAVGMFEPTQAPKGYHQQIIYAQSLL